MQIFFTALRRRLSARWPGGAGVGAMRGVADEQALPLGVVVGQRRRTQHAADGGLSATIARAHEALEACARTARHRYRRGMATKRRWPTGARMRRRRFPASGIR
ncbi:MAG: hypothetical protein U1E90_16670 [Burkholderiaceae bacterium]